MKRAYGFVKYKLPNEYNWVGQLIKSLITKYPRIIAAVTNIQGSTAQNIDQKLRKDQKKDLMEWWASGRSEGKGRYEGNINLDNHKK